MKRMLSLLLAALTAAALCLPGLAAGLDSFQKVRDYTPGQFTDVPADSWCAANVQTVYEYGIMLGKTDTLFGADGSLTLAQTIVLACRIHSTYYQDGAEFPVSEPWYQSYVDYTLKEKLIPGAYSGYDKAVSRASFAQILGAALPDEALGEISSIEDGSIPDVPADANYAAAVYRLYRAGVLTGNDRKGTFTPFQPITRGAAAAIVGRMLVPGQRIAITLVQAPFEPVPVTKLANLKSLRKKTTDAEFRQAYDAAVELVTPLGKLSREDQLYGIAVALRDMVESGQVAYSMSAAHYNDPYGYFVAGVSSCAGCTRATGLCLNILGIPYEHVNENQYAHQWCRVKMPDGSYWICDAYGLYVGPEPAPYQHPYL